MNHGPKAASFPGQVCAEAAQRAFFFGFTLIRMFTAKAQKNRGAATSYFDEHLSQNDYYTEDVGLDRRAGQWIGLGAERLGLGQTVDREGFLKLCDNQHPVRDGKLTPGNVEGRRIFFDFQCAPPKSVSILGVTMQDERIIQAHREASQVAFRELETFASARVRKGGVDDRDRVTGNLVGAAFMHTASRALDPQLHTHFVLFNATFDPAERQWKALQTAAMFESIHYATSAYRNELARRLRGIGYALRPTSTGFEIDGVSPELIERFSKRSKERDEAVRRAEQRLGRKLCKDEIAHVVHQSRPRKPRNASEQDVRSRQLHEIGFFEKRSLRKVVAAAKGQRSFDQQAPSEKRALEYAVSHVFERLSVVPEHRLLEAAPGQGLRTPESEAAQGGTGEPC
jgi:conjugative relaxase-like TrwC/TraI family protein